MLARVSFIPNWGKLFSFIEYCDCFCIIVHFFLMGYISDIHLTLSPQRQSVISQNHTLFAGDSKTQLSSFWGLLSVRSQSLQSIRIKQNGKENLGLRSQTDPNLCPGSSVYYVTLGRLPNLSCACFLNTESEIITSPTSQGLGKDNHNKNSYY